MKPRAMEPGPNARIARYVRLQKIEQAFAGSMHRLRNAAACSNRSLWPILGNVLDTIESAERAKRLRNAAHFSYCT